MLKLTTPYDYKSLTRTNVDGKRMYVNPWGSPVPSVTTILDQTKPKESREALANWRKRVGEKRAHQITTEAASVGTSMHYILEQWVKNEPVTDKITLQSKIMAETVIRNIENDIDEVWGSEVNLCYPEVYAGTTDLVGVYKGKPTIMDFKQTNKPKKREWIDDYFMQGCAYALAHNHLYNTEIKNIAIFMCSRDCDFQLFEIDQAQFDKWSLKWTNRVSEFYKIK
mgnify:FL=1